ncbi:tyrosine-type recombinase/integrase [Planctomycetota bacterium]
MACLYPRGKVWWIKYYVNGQQEAKSLKTGSRKKAEVEKARIEADLEAGRIRPKSRRLKVTDFVEVYREHYVDGGGPDLRKSRLRSWKKDLAALRAPFDYFTNTLRLKQVADIKPTHVERYRNWRLKKKVKAGTVNKSLRCASAAMSWARGEGYIDENPFLGVRKVKQPVYDPRTLSDFEIRKLLSKREEVNAEPAGLTVWVALYAGLRNTELCLLDWRDLDRREDQVHVRCVEGQVTKGREGRVVPMASELNLLLGDHAREDGLVCPSRLGGSYRPSSICAAVKRISRNVGVDFTLQVLRRTFVTRLLREGVPESIVMEYAGHKCSSTTRSYYVGRNLARGTRYTDVLNFGLEKEPEVTPRKRKKKQA